VGDGRTFVRVLAIAAHPDDETLFAGGMLAKLAYEGNELIILCTTRGEGGEVGDPPMCLKEDLGRVREGEMRCAAEVLGASHVCFLDFVDPSIEIGETGRAIDASLDEFASSLALRLQTIRPDLVITHGSNGEYGHPQHVFTHCATRTALVELDLLPSPGLWTWAAASDGTQADRITNREDSANFVLGISPWFDLKARAAQCHLTQHAMIKRNSGKKELRDAIRTLEAYRMWPKHQWAITAKSSLPGDPRAI
jgi:N-acetylglucosamine malate deacetylase 2